MIIFVIAMLFGALQSAESNADRVIRTPGAFRYETAVPDGTLVVTIRGEVVLTPDRKDVMHLAPDSSIVLDEKTRRRERRLEIRRDGAGALKRTLIVDRQLKLVDEETKAWLATVLPDALTRSRARSDGPARLPGDVKSER